MEAGRLMVDSIDVSQKYGVFVAENGYNSLIAMPTIKTPEQNDWHEHDGSEVYSKKWYFESQEITIKFCFAGRFASFTDFINMLSTTSYHSFFFTGINRHYNLRMVQNGVYRDLRDIGTATIKFINDAPAQFQEYHIGIPTILQNYKYKLHYIPLTQFNINVLQGTLSEITKPPTVKKNLTINVFKQNGSSYDDDTVKFNSKEVKLYCLMRAETLTQLWKNYDGFFYELTRPNTRKLYVGDLEQEFDCYYKSCEVTRFYPHDKIWLEFTITLVFFGDFRINSSNFVLAAEDDRIITTEAITGIETAFIEMKYN